MGSACKVGDDRASQSLLDGDIGLRLNNNRFLAFSMQKTLWVNQSRFANIERRRTIGITDEVTNGYENLKIKNITNYYDSIYPVPPNRLTATQRIYLREGMGQKIWELCWNKRIPLIFRNTIWRFITKTLPLFHKNKTSQPLLESS